MQSKFAFERSVIGEFGEMHGIKACDISHTLRETSEQGELRSGHGLVFGTVGDSQQEVPEIGKG
jgi:hypothetical protein